MPHFFLFRLQFLRMVCKTFSVFGFWFCSFYLLSAQATEPVSQPSNIQFASVKTYNFVMSFTPAVADGYLILKGTQNITDVPVDGTTYEKGQGLASCKVMYVGANNIHNVREVLENSIYYFKVFAYNGSGNQINYLQVNPLSGTVTTPVADAGSYYAGIDSNSGSFLNDLHTLINNHTTVAYTSYKSNIVPAIFERDTTGSQVVINCEYSNETTIYTPPFDFNAQAYNREHVLCKSWMQTAAIYGAGNLVNYTEGADYFNLLLTRSTPNVTRSNNPLGIVSNVSSTYGESKFGTDNSGNTVFEPKPNRKGDAARAMMYEMVCYNGLSGGWGLNQLLSQAGEQDQNILKLWNQQDPPDRFERTKNDYINSLQHNRNPFIDHPEWAACINFDSIVKTLLCGQVSGLEDGDLALHAKWYPNPASDLLFVELPLGLTGETTIEIVNMYGQPVLQQIIQNTSAAIRVAPLAKGSYVLRVFNQQKSTCSKLMKIE